MPCLRSSFALSAALLALLCFGPVHAADDPIRLGFLTGRKLELFVGDTAGQPAITKTKAQDLIEKNRVHSIIGPLAAFEALAIHDTIRGSETPTISPSAAAEDLTQRRPNPWFARARLPCRSG
jgi:ABC-type branched-subunit amino acid transport system substrate-binding protein